MTTELKLKRTPIQDRLEVWRIGVGKFPIPAGQRRGLAEFLLGLMHAASARYSLTESVWIEATHIHLEGATTLIGPNARAWAPQTGFGIHPDGVLPRMWTDEDFSGAAFGTKLPTFNNQVFQISRADGYVSAIQAMAGRGVLMFALVTGTVDAYKRGMRTTLEPLVKERAFHAYPFFFPLLTATSASNAHFAQWMGNASVYVREVFEEQEVQILSAVPLGPCFQTMGVHETSANLWIWSSGG